MAVNISPTFYTKDTNGHDIKDLKASIFFDLKKVKSFINKDFHIYLASPKYKQKFW